MMDSEDQSACSCDCESCGSKRCHLLGPSSQVKDTDCSGSYDCSFKRNVWSGWEINWFDSVHVRCKKWASSGDMSSEDSSDGPIPMDWNQVNSNSCADDSCCQSASECSRSQGGRSSDNDDNICGQVHGGELATGSDFICQWTCGSGDAEFTQDTVQSFQCESGFKDMTLNKGDSYKNCISQCKGGDMGCGISNELCVEQCQYLSSGALDVGAAKCKSPSGTAPKERPKRFTDGEVAGLWVAYFAVMCCCQCCLVASKARRNAQS